QSLGPEWTARPFGSMVSGFGWWNSDLDVTCILEDALVKTGDQQGSGLEAMQILREQLLPKLQAHPRFQVTKAVLGARVPVLKLKFDGKVDVDLSCNNVHGLRNTQLLKAYAELSPVLRELVVLVKQWAKRKGVLGASSGQLSAYSFTLLAIYFLQVHPLFLLPCLPTSSFTCSGPVGPDGAELSFGSWPCQVPTPLLFASFLHFYAKDFRWGAEVVSVRLGRGAAATLFEKLPGRENTRLHIEDPYLLGRNLNCVLGDVGEDQLWGTFQRTVLELAAKTRPFGQWLLAPSRWADGQEYFVTSRAPGCLVKHQKGEHRPDGATTSEEGVEEPKDLVLLAGLLQPDGSEAQRPLEPAFLGCQSSQGGRIPVVKACLH
ncbi:unnamed protein product, partial [Polarella glacialis]